MPQQLRLALAARAHLGEPVRCCCCAPTARSCVPTNIATSPTLSSAPSISTRCRTANSRSPYSSILGRWWPVLRILDRQRVQIELRLHRGELLRRRVQQRDPDEAFRPADVSADLARLDVGQLAAVLIGNAVDEHDRFLRAESYHSGGWRLLSPISHHIAPIGQAGAPSLSMRGAAPALQRLRHQLPESSAVAWRHAGSPSAGPLVADASRGCVAPKCSV